MEESKHNDNNNLYENYIIEKKLALGSFGRIYAIRSRHDYNQRFILKINNDFD